MSMLAFQNKTWESERSILSIHVNKDHTKVIYLREQFNGNIKRLKESTAVK